jgi:hypothetical protein
MRYSLVREIWNIPRKVAAMMMCGLPRRQEEEAP